MALLDADYSHLDPALAKAVRGLIAASGGKVSLGSGYRTIARQQELYDQGLKRWGKDLVSKHVAKPGSSQHNIFPARAVDLNGNLALAARLAPQYNLSQILPNTDPVHFELIGNRSGKSSPAVQSAQTGRTQAMPSSAITKNSDFEDRILSAMRRVGALPSPVPSVDYTPDEPIVQSPDMLMQAGLPYGPDRSPVSNTQLEGAFRRQAAQTAPNIPLEQSILRSKSLASKLPGILQRYGGLADKYFQPQSDYVLPQVTPRNVEAIPQRGNAKPNTFARIIAALGGLIKPGSAGDFAAAELGAENQGADREYQDALTRYKLATEQDNQAFEDQSNERNLMIRNDQANRAASLENQLRRYGADTLGLGEELKYADEPPANDLQGIADQQRRANALEAQADTLKEQDARLRAKAQLQSGYEKAALVGDNARMRAILSGEYGLEKTKAAGEQARTTETQKQTGRIDLQKLRGETQLANIDKRYQLSAVQKNLDRQSREKIAGMVHGGVGAKGPSASRLQRGEIALENAKKAREKVMQDYRSLVAKEGGESSVDSSTKQLFGKHYEAMAQLETQARKERDVALGEYTASQTPGKTTPANRPNAKTLNASAQTRKQFHDASGKAFWAHVENGKWVKE